MDDLAFLDDPQEEVISKDNMNELEIAISQEVTDLVEQILGVDPTLGEVLPKDTLDAIDRSSCEIGQIAISHLCE